MVAWVDPPLWRPVQLATSRAGVSRRMVPTLFLVNHYMELREICVGTSLSGSGFAQPRRQTIYSAFPEKLVMICDVNFIILVLE